MAVKWSIPSIMTARISTGAVTYDTDAQAFFTAAGITNITQKSAINTLVTTLKSNGLWAGLQAIFPFVGGSAVPHSYNLKNTATFQITWVGSPVHDSNGVQFDGSSNYGYILYNGSTDGSANTNAFGFYSRTTSTAAKYDMGQDNQSGTRDIWLLGAGASGTSISLDSYNTGTLQVAATHASTQGLFINTRTSSTDFRAWRNSTQVGATTTTAATLTLPFITRFGIGCWMTGNNTPSNPASGYSDKQFAFAFVANVGLSSTDVSNLYSAVQAFETTLGRNV